MWNRLLPFRESLAAGCFPCFVQSTAIVIGNCPFIAGVLRHGMQYVEKGLKSYEAKVVETEARLVGKLPKNKASPLSLPLRIK
jgi:hypothetical protein